MKRHELERTGESRLLTSSPDRVQQMVVVNFHLNHTLWLFWSYLLYVCPDSKSIPFDFITVERGRPYLCSGAQVSSEYPFPLLPSTDRCWALPQNTAVGWDDLSALSPPTAWLKALGNQNPSLGEAHRRLSLEIAAWVSARQQTSILVPVGQSPGQ